MKPTRNASLGERRKKNMKKKIECPYAQAGSYKLDCTNKGFCLYQEAGAHYPMCGKPDSVFPPHRHCSCGTELSEGMKPTQESWAASVA